MKQNCVFFLLAIILSTLVQSSCNDPTVIGSELLAGDQLDIQFTDTISIRTYNIVEDSISIFDPDFLAGNNASFPLGVYEDPIFGTSSSEIYAEVTLNGILPNFNESGAELDSVLLILPYNAKASYGDLEDNFSLEVFQLRDQLPDEELFSNRDYPVETLIGTYDYRPAVNDSIEIFSPTLDSTIKLSPQIRIPLDMNDFDDRLFNVDDFVDTLTVVEFEAFMRGIAIRPTTTNKGMPSFNFRSNSSGIRVYYHVDTATFEYIFPIFPDNVVTAKYVHDYSPSMIDIEGQFLGENAPFTDSLVFIQGMSGINFVIEVPHSESLSDKVLNKAEIVFPIQFLAEDAPNVYLPVDQIVVSEILDDGTLDLIDDVRFATNREGLGGFSTLFGGIQESDDTYRVNVTSHLQDMSRGLVTERMMVNLFLKSEQASRVVLNGPGHSAQPAKLNLTFTNF